MGSCLSLLAKLGMQRTRADSGRSLRVRDILDWTLGADIEKSLQQVLSPTSEIRSEPSVWNASKYMTDSMAPRNADFAPTEVNQPGLWFNNN